MHCSGLQLQGFHLVVAAKLAGVKKIIVHIHGFSGDSLEIGIFKKTIMSILIEPITMLLATKIYCNSNYSFQRRAIKVFNKKSIGWIYNFPPLAAKYNINIRQALGINRNDFVVVSAARITLDKGYGVFSKVIKQFSSHRGIKFILLGDGSYLDTLKNELKPQIDNNQLFCLGHRNDVQEILKECDAFVLPTLHETLSNVLIEASIEGLPLIASDTGGVPEIVEGNYNGILVKPGYVKGFVSAIQLLQSNDQLCKYFSQNAKQRVADKFSQSKIEKKITVLYNSVIDV